MSFAANAGGEAGKLEKNLAVVPLRRIETTGGVVNGNTDGRRPIGAGHGDAGLGSEQAPERYIKAADRPTVSEKRIESSPFFRRRCIPAVFPMIDEGSTA